MTATAVVDAARPSGSQLHRYFEWDDIKAAESWRHEQARHLLRSIEVQIEIRDQGIGIDWADMSRLFQRFSRINTDLTYGIPGTGLGLYLAQELVRRHGGEITVSSKVGMGSVFCVSLPLALVSIPQ